MTTTTLRPTFDDDLWDVLQKEIEEPDSVDSNLGEDVRLR